MIWSATKVFKLQQTRKACVLTQKEKNRQDGFKKNVIFDFPYISFTDTE
jgi:hypothetical protein